MKDNSEMTKEELIALGWIKKPSDKMQEKTEKQLTAVEWYIKKIKEARQMCDDASMGMDIWHTLDVLIGKGEQAKEMEKEQIMNAWNNGFEENRPYVDHSEDYYNKTFKSE
jgi:predicted secreted protein